MSRKRHAPLVYAAWRIDAIANRLGFARLISVTSRLAGWAARRDLNP